jgi:hypothetical protein
MPEIKLRPGRIIEPIKLSKKSNKSKDLNDVAFANNKKNNVKKNDNKKAKK